MMEYIFGLSRTKDVRVDFPLYCQYTTRYVLVQVIEVHKGTWLLLLGVLLANAARVKAGASVRLRSSADMGSAMFCMCGAALAAMAIVVHFKIFHILQGICEDIRVERAGAKLNWRALQHQVLKVANDSSKKMVEDSSLAKSAGRKAAETALGVVQRLTKTARIQKLGRVAGSMRRSAKRASLLAHHGATTARKKDRHGHHFWFGRPKFLLFLLQTLFFFEALYITFFSLVFARYGLRVWGGMAFWLMAFFPAFILFVMFPLIIPPLVLILDLTGYIGEDDLAQVRRRGQLACLHACMLGFAAWLLACYARSIATSAASAPPP